MHHKFWGTGRAVLPVAGVVIALASSAPAWAGPCDYRPSKMAEGAAAPAGAATKAIGSNAEEKVKSAGVYTLTGGNAGASLLGAGSTASSAMATASAVISAPAALLAGAAAAVGLAGYEGLCYFSDKRVTKYNDVLAVMRNLSQNADPDYFHLDEGTKGKKDAAITLRNSSGESERHAVSNLYIVNGELRYRESGRDGVIGNVDFVARSTESVGAPLSAVKDEKAAPPPALVPAPVDAPAPAAPTTADAQPPAPAAPAAESPATETPTNATPAQPAP